MMPFRPIAAVLGFITLAGCALFPEQSPIPVKPFCPEPPSLPIILETELLTLSESAYRRLVERDLLRAEHIRLLEANCE